LTIDLIQKPYLFNIQEAVYHDWAEVEIETYSRLTSKYCSIHKDLSTVSRLDRYSTVVQIHNRTQVNSHTIIYIVSSYSTDICPSYLFQRGAFNDEIQFIVLQCWHLHLS